MKRLFLGHHKCGTLWLDRIFKELISHYKAVGKRDFGTDLSVYMDKMNLETIFFVHANTESLETFSPQEFRAVHIIRDPRDMAVSAYYSHRYTHSTEEWPALAEHRKKISGSNASQGLLEDIKWSANMPIGGDCFCRLFDDLKISERENIKTVKFEALTSDTATVLRKCFRFLHLERLPSFRIVINENSFEKLTGRKKGEIDDSSHMRSGKPGSWREHFTGEIKDYFKGRWGSLLIDLGYEKSLDW